MIWLVFGIAFLLALGLPADALDGTVASMIITFFGLLAAGFVPAITLLASTSFSGKHTVKRLRELKRDTDILSDRIMSTLTFILVGGIFSIISAIHEEYNIEYNIFGIDMNIHDIFDRILQAVVVACFVVAIDRMRLMKSAFQRVLEERYKAAEEEAKSRIDDNASSLEVKSAFKRPASFGKVVKIEQAEGAGNGR